MTGSMFLLELDANFKILIDCGMDMENPAERMPLYPGSAFPFDASLINLVVLTHAHLDHSGKIPNLLREGFEGKIVCTEPTFEQARLLLNDSAAINRGKLNFYHKKRSKDPGFKPEFSLDELYLERHVDQAMERFLPVEADKKHKVIKGVQLTLVTTGHLLGAANVLLEIEEEGEVKKILFSGDIGRSDYPLLKDPAPAPQADYVVCETTYGNRFHQSKEQTEESLATMAIEACVKTPGKLIVPAFSIGRTQAILYTFHKAFAAGMLPDVKIYADSPLAQKSNKVYEQFADQLNNEAQEFKAMHKQLFAFQNLQYIEQTRESKRISNLPEPAILVSSSGMLEGGRIQHHIKNHLQNPQCTILMVGFSAEGTFGRRLLESDGMLRVGKRDVPVLARVQQTDVFSGHGDQNDLLKFVKSQSPEKTRRVFLVHGEPESMRDFKEVLLKEGYKRIEMPEKGKSYRL